MSTPILPTFWFHGDIVDLQARLKNGLDATDRSVSSCGALDDATKASWASFYKLASGFCNESAAWLNTGQQADVGQGYESDLVAWQQKLSVKCALSAPFYNPPGGSNEKNSTVKYIAIAAGVLGTAYVVGQVAAFIPRPRREAQEAHRRVVRLSARAPRALRGR